MIHTLDLDTMSEFYGLKVKDLKKRTYACLELMEQDMKRRKAEEEALRNAEDEEFARIVRTCFSAYPLLSRCFTDAEIISACSRHGADAFTETYCVPHGKPDHRGGEFLETGMGFLPRYARNGEQLLYGEYALCDKYRIRRYTQTCTGDIVLDLLYGRYPELAEFGFSAYSYNECGKDGWKAYEIYPKNHIYTPFWALMEGDIDAIRRRNLDYARSYNFGAYTVKAVSERLASEEAARYFAAIEGLARESKG